MTTPDHIGKYEDLRLIGQGGFGNVYRAWDPDLRRQVAVKVMHAQFAQDERWVASFQQEARLMARVDQHPNVVRVIELQQDEQHGLFIAMDYYPRGNLDSLIRREGPFSVERAVGLLLQIANGLSAAHAAGIVHRDIKPLNILLDDDLACKISDFGIAASTDRSIYTRIGSPPYMAPEQKLGRVTDTRADIYSLGVTLYQMLVGDLPEELSQTEKPPDPSLQRPEIPERVVQILFKAIEFDAEDRYQSVDELIAELQSYTSAPDSTPTDTEPEASASGEMPEKPSESAIPRALARLALGTMTRLILFVGGAIAVIAIVLAVIFGLSGNDDQSLSGIAGGISDKVSNQISSFKATVLETPSKRIKVFVTGGGGSTWFGAIRRAGILIITTALTGRFGGHTTYLRCFAGS